MQFILKINLGNAGMQDRDDIASALRSVADRMVKIDGANIGTLRIRDINGNTVGNARIIEGGQS